ncbi:excisionase family DNA binding protein [Rhizobium azooxidifex]|uniref:Excisionase family DNA binding protein n=1 Tax=Mycoplana azooxidifex TaxID=1636188 RepID=A0A7W6DGB5_9HYPH|nr:excisionase family DNA binding protein [Mycoplana azooxidifex]
MMRLGEFAARCGVTTRTIQRYIEDGKLQPTERTPGGHMRFDAGKVREFRHIWRDPRGKPRGYERGTVSSTRSGTTEMDAKQSAYRFVQDTKLKRSIVSQSSSSTAANSDTLGLEDLL